MLDQGPPNTEARHGGNDSIAFPSSQQKHYCTQSGWTPINQPVLYSNLPVELSIPAEQQPTASNKAKAARASKAKGSTAKQPKVTAKRAAPSSSQNPRKRVKQDQSQQLDQAEDFQIPSHQQQLDYKEAKNLPIFEKPPVAFFGSDSTATSSTATLDWNNTPVHLTSDNSLFSAKDIDDLFDNDNDDDDSLSELDALFEAEAAFQPKPPPSSEHLIPTQLLDPVTYGNQASRASVATPWTSSPLIDTMSSQMSPAKQSSNNHSATAGTQSTQALANISPDVKPVRCFRIGEAINVGAHALRELQVSSSSSAVFIELYARVQDSTREQNGPNQFFRLMDLRHDKPPYLNAIFDLWKDNPRRNKESRVFLDQPKDGNKKLCRCLGQIQRDGQGNLLLVLLDIWETSWENAGYSQGIAQQTARR